MTTYTPPPMPYDPETGDEKPYPSHPDQWRVANPRSAWLFNPWSGRRRTAQDVGTDPFGTLCRAPGEPLMASGQRDDAADARRYRWAAESKDNAYHLAGIVSVYSTSRDDIDGSVDAAMAKEASDA